ncbi:MAG: diacylglycerol kinase family protein [bacterium]|nr:diacylglycerol kinase family protein [bacterium]
MFFYLYDTFVLEKKHENTLTGVENRIIELGINGRVEKLTALRNMKELLESAVKQEAHTIVVVGDDATFVKAINILAQQDVTIGYIPFSDQSNLAQIFGIPDTFEACNILSRRIIKTFDLGKANQNYFLTAAIAENCKGLQIKCNDQYTISFPKHQAQASFLNLGNVLQQPFDETSIRNTTNKQLILEITEPIKKSRFRRKNTEINEPIPTQLPLQKATLDHESEPIEIRLDNETTLKTPISITVKPKSLKAIVGKERLI